ncbi:MAG: DHA1 family bicyclomycin/chloramphenicol resistance-like MFS transporter [Motiliproteus sp.]|jgi:DHA1 family bicyclomycin/chloramphenicol resistance-like MFS transporter
MTPGQSTGTTSGLNTIQVGVLGFSLLGILSGMGALSIDMYLPAFPAIASGLGVDASRVQLTLSIFLLGFALGQAIHGPLSDRFGRKPVILWGLALYGLASVGCALSLDIDQLLLARFLQGMAGASGSVLARAVVRDLYQGEALARAMSWLMLVMTAAPMLAPLIGSSLLLLFDWESIFWFLSGFSMLWLLLIAWYIPETRGPASAFSLHPKALLGVFSTVLGHRQAMAYALAGGCGFGGMFSYIAGTPFIYMDLYGVTPFGYAALFAINIAGMALGSLLNSRYIGQLGRDGMIRFLTTLLLIAAVVLVGNGMSGWGGLWGLVLPLLVYVGCLGALAANCISGTLEFFPHTAGTASSVFGVLQFGLGSLGGAATSLLNDGTALPMAGVILGLALLAFGLFRIMLDRPVTKV